MHRSVKAFLRPPHSTAARMVESFAQSLFGGISADSSDGKVRMCHSSAHTTGIVMTVMLAWKEELLGLIVVCTEPPPKAAGEGEC